MALFIDGYSEDNYDGDLQTSGDATDGTEGEIVYNLDDNTFYGCTATGDPATWVALH